MSENMRAAVPALESDLIERVANYGVGIIRHPGKDFAVWSECSKLGPSIPGTWALVGFLSCRTRRSRRRRSVWDKWSASDFRIPVSMRVRVNSALRFNRLALGMFRSASDLI